MKNALNATQNHRSRVIRCHTDYRRIYANVRGEDGNAGTNAARLYRTDDAVHATNASFTDLTATATGIVGAEPNIGYCTGQCWYDNVVYSPPGKPDVVYLGGSF